MKSIKVLVVDDEKDFLASLVRRLKRRQLEVQGVDSGQAALDHLAAHPVDVVVLDVKMPGMDGLEALSRIKETHPFVEVILLTGHASVDAGMKGISLGAFEYLIKPVTLDQLLERINEAFDRRQVIRETNPD
jgi:DNA-binding NtrC family response regulator